MGFSVNCDLSDISLHEKTQMGFAVNCDPTDSMPCNGPGSFHIQETTFADNTPGAMVHFDADQHRKYNAHAYFKASSRDAADSSQPHSTVLEKYRMTDPPRGKHAQVAYDEFVRGLEVIGAQEHVVSGGRGHTTTTISKEDEAAVLEELQEKLKFEGTHSMSEPEFLRQLAIWERYKKLRADAPLRRNWYRSLRARAWSTHDQDGFHKVDPGKLPKIRKGTFQLLTRPAERDFDVNKYLVRLGTAVTMIYALYAQITVFLSLCPDAYMCPISSGIWPVRPVGSQAT